MTVNEAYDKINNDIFAEQEAEFTKRLKSAKLDLLRAKKGVLAAKKNRDMMIEILKSVEKTIKEELTELANLGKES